MAVSRPRIGINADLVPAFKQNPAAFRLHVGYVDAVVAAGGLAVIVPPFTRDLDLDEYLDDLDGFVLTGAAGDLDPRRHGLPTHHLVAPVPERREESDRALVRKIVDRRMPVLAVGLGMQQLNVALGGTLFLHIPEDLPRALPHRDPTGQTHRHIASIKPGTRFEEIYGPGEIRVNSSHHMAVRQAGTGLRVSVVAPDGVVEAVEGTDPEWCVLGVQWHPEADSATALDLQLFECVVEAARQGVGLRLAA